MNDTIPEQTDTGRSQSKHSGPKRSGPMLPRRAMLAAVLSAAVAGGAVALSMLGAVSQPETDNFRFSRGTSFSAGEDQRLRGFLAQALPDDRVQVVVVGHTGDQGDATANLALSVDRAEVVLALAREMGIEADRVSATGVGGASPLTIQEGEGPRAHQSRLSRVDVTLQQRR